MGNYPEQIVKQLVMNKLLRFLTVIPYTIKRLWRLASVQNEPLRDFLEQGFNEMEELQ